MDWARNLPPLDLFTAFEAAARRGSFTRAGEELGVTQSAVSQRIRALEDALGVRLFERRHRAVQLTPAGRDLLAGVTVALRHLLAATATLRTDGARTELRIATDQSVAEMWLAPRLHRFATRHPDIALSLLVSDRAEECLSSDASVLILHGSGATPGYRATLLFEDEIFPVASPAYLAGFVEGTLSEARLIDLDYLHWDWMNWTIWLTEQGLDTTAQNRALRCNSYPLVIEAARQDQGVALGWRRFVDDDLIAGRLTIAAPGVARPGSGYYLLQPLGADGNAAADAFADWIEEECAAQPLAAV